MSEESNICWTRININTDKYKGLSMIILKKHVQLLYIMFGKKIHTKKMMSFWRKLNKMHTLNSMLVKTFKRYMYDFSMNQKPLNVNVCCHDQSL